MELLKCGLVNSKYIPRLRATTLTGTSSERWDQQSITVNETQPMVNRFGLKTSSKTASFGVLILLAISCWLCPSTQGEETTDKATQAIVHRKKAKDLITAEAPRTAEEWQKFWTQAPQKNPGKGIQWPLVLLDSVLFFPPYESINLSPLKTVAFTAFLLQKTNTYQDWVHDNYPRGQDIRLTGPYLEPDPTTFPTNYDGAAYMTHSRVKVYYSDAVVTWLENDRKGDIPDGSMIIKEMFDGNPKGPISNDITGYAVMVRQKAASKDGWLWYIWFVNTPAPFAQQGMSFCLSCHSSTDNDQNTFVYLGNITGKDPTTDTYISNPGPGKPPSAKVRSRSTSPHAGLGKALSMAADEKKQTVRAASLKTPGSSSNQSELPFPSFPMDLVYNHVVAKAGADGKNTAQFLTSDSCVGCHDASYLQNSRLPAMMLPNPASNNYFNLSEWSEWNGSMMSQSGRDPVFHAQLESERALRPAYKDYISDFCFSCHAPMGQRQFHLDNKGEYFTPEILLSTPDSTNADPKMAKYGALARDGVSCTVCHHITPEKLGTEESFNAQFVTGPAHEIFGPYKDEPATSNLVKKVPMEKGLGITPGHGAAISKSAMCGSCHTVMPDIIPTHDGLAGILKGKGHFKKSHEQTTYMEWVNSRFNDEEGAHPGSKSCIDCHMPDYFGSPTNKLSFQIANVEDGDFPSLPTRDHDTNITLQARSPYRRHTLVGLNLFTMKMFQQFGDSLLGRMTFDPYITIPPSRFYPVDRFDLAEQEVLELARQTVALTVASPAEKAGKLNVAVTVTNLAGHSFPSGVGFRRAFLQLNVLDATGKVLWASGRTSTNGVLLDEQGIPLRSEFTTNWQDLQVDHEVITRQDQVQVYEERHLDDTGVLTTSFLSLFKEIKRNRLLPQGWSPEGKYAEHTRPVKLGGEEVERPTKIGFDHVSYEIPLSEIPGWAKIEVGCYYQALPPYYLEERSRTKGPNNSRLQYLTANLKTAGTAIADWKLPLAKVTVRNPSTKVSSR